jgi:hypothetical protein
MLLDCQRLSPVLQLQRLDQLMAVFHRQAFPLVVRQAFQVQREVAPLVVGKTQAS